MGFKFATQSVYVAQIVILAISLVIPSSLRGWPRLLLKIASVSWIGLACAILSLQEEIVQWDPLQRSIAISSTVVLGAALALSVARGWTLTTQVDNQSSTPTTEGDVRRAYWIRDLNRPRSAGLYPLAAANCVILLTNFDLVELNEVQGEALLYLREIDDLEDGSVVCRIARIQAIHDNWLL